jgi:hypothetical protein
MSRMPSREDGFHACGSRRQRAAAQPLIPRHRISDVLQEEGITLRTAALRMGIRVSQASQEADATCDLNLSALGRWQAALQVPIADLLTPPNPSLSAAIGWRAGLVKAMKTVRSLQLHIDNESVQLLSISLAQQLMEMMPELTTISSWPVCGRRRPGDELGVIVDRQLPDEFFSGPED